MTVVVARTQEKIAAAKPPARGKRANGAADAPGTAKTAAAGSKSAVATPKTVERRPAYDDFAAQIEAIHRSQAIIEFTLDGTIITANQNFLDVLGYTLTEIQGRHHSMFVEPIYR